MNTKIQIRPITAAQTHPLRLAVLRPGRPLESVVFPGDDAPQACHLGAFSGEDIFGIASLYPEPLPGEAASGDWRLRGMAIAPDHQRQGIGRVLLAACLEHVRSQGGTRLWCNARSTARCFYEAQGFTIRGEEFDIPGVGPHFVMCYNMAGGVRPC